MLKAARETCAFIRRELLQGRPSLPVVMLAGLGVGFGTFSMSLGRVYTGESLPYRDSRRLALITLVDAAGHERGLSLGQIKVLQDAELFTGVAAYRPGRVHRLLTPGEAVAVPSVFVTKNLFDVFGVDGPRRSEWNSYDGHDDVPIVRAAREEQRLPFGIGTWLERQDGGRVLVAGASDPSFFLPRREHAAVYEPIVADQPTTDTHTVVARLAATTQAGGALDARMSVLLSDATQVKARSRSLHSFLTDRTTRLGHGVWTLGFLVVLGAAANLSNLLFAATLQGARNYSTRAALGATPGYLASTLFGGAAVQALFAAAVAAATAWALALTWSQIVPADLRLLGSARFGPSEWVLVALGSAFVVGGASVMSSVAIVRIATAPLSSGRYSGTGSGSIIRRSQIAAQVCTALVMFGACGVASSHYVRLATAETGIASDLHVVSVSYRFDKQGDALRSQVLDTLRSLRAQLGPERAAVLIGTLFDNTNMGAFVSGPRGESLPVSLKYVSGRAIEIGGVEILAGRALNDADEPWEAGVVSRSLARQFASSPSEALGQQLRTPARVISVVGVVDDIKDVSVDAPATPTLYVPLGRLATRALVHYLLDAPEHNLSGRVGPLLRKHDPHAIVVGDETVRDKLASAMGTQRAAFLFSALFSVFAGGLVAAGVASTVSFIVARRRREIAVRLALGAGRGHIYSVLGRDVIVGAGCGLALGVFCTQQLIAFTNSFFTTPVSVGPGDTLASVLLISAIIAGAAWVPIRRVIAVPIATAVHAE